MRSTCPNCGTFEDLPSESVRGDVKCLKCGTSFPPPVAPLHDERTARVDRIVAELERLPDADRQVVRMWAEGAHRIVNDPVLSRRLKLARLTKLENGRVLRVFLTTLFKTLKRHAWDRRGWPARLALGGLLVGIAVPGKAAVGIAGFGGAIAVPLWLLTTAGAALLGEIVQAFEQMARRGAPADPDPTIRDTR